MPDLDPRYFLSIFLRRFPVFLLTAVLIFSGFAAAAVLLPSSYSARARILVEAQQIPTNLVQSTVGSHAAERLNVIQQRLMTRENLLDIANTYGVFRDRQDLSPSEMVNQMRRSTRFRQVRLGGSRDGGMSMIFIVSFSAERPDVIASVVSEYVTRILEDNVRLRTGRAANTYEFFDQESQRLAGELTAVETEIVEFKRANRDTLPETLGFRSNQLERVQQRQQILDRERADLRRERRQLTELMENPDLLVPDTREPSEAERSRAQLMQRRRLRLALLSETHPEIRGLDTRIATLDRIIAQEAETRAANAERRRERRMTSEMQRVTQELETVERRLARIEDDLVGLERRESELQRGIIETPNTRMALAALNRNYANLQRQYQSARQKLAISATGEQLELKQQAERFEVIEQPSTPRRPNRPNRMRLLMLGAMGGGGAGLALIVLLELLNRAIRRPADIISTLETQPLGVIPYIYTDGELRRRSVFKWTLTGTIVLGLIIGVTAVHIFYMPLDLLMSRLMEMTQLDTVLQLVRTRLGL